MAMPTVFPDVPALADGAAHHFADLASAAITWQGVFRVALAGGSTPQCVYRRLTSSAFAPRIDWSRIHVFWGDERCVPPDHPDSNYRMARESLVDHVPLATDQVHRMRGEIDPREAAGEYERILRTHFSQVPGAHPSSDAAEHRQPGRFDLILLGMGDDGHTASLFPGTAAVREGERWVAAHFVEKLGAWRITLTPAVINDAANIAFLVAGGQKTERLRQVLTGPYQPDILPAQVILPWHGSLRWLVDAAAAAGL